MRWLGLLFLTSFSTSVFCAETQNYWVSLEFIDTNGKPIVSESFPTDGAPGLWSSGHTIGYPSISCTTNNNVKTKTLKSNLLFSGIKVQNKVESKTLLLDVEFDNVISRDKEIREASNTDCINIEPSVVTTRDNLKLKMTSGSSNTVALKNGMKLLYRFEVH